MPDPEQTNERLIAFLLGDPEAPTPEQVEAATRRDPGTASRLAALREVLRDLEDARELERLFTVDPSRLSRIAIASAPPSPLAARLREVIAELVTLPRAGLAPAFRSGAAQGGLRYVGEDVEIDLRPARLRASVEGLYEGEVEIIGRVVVRGSSDRAREARLIGDGNVVAVASPDPDGFFELRVRPGRYRVEVAFDDRVVVADSVDLTGDS